MSFDDLIGSEGLTPEVELRLRRVHDLLVEVGPPPDLSPGLERVPEPADPPEVPLIFRRRKMAVAVLALAAALAAFGGGYAFGHSKSSSSAFASAHTVPMHGKPGQLAVIKVGNVDSAGNWPMLVEVSGLPQQAKRGAYYELWLTKNGKAVLSCGSFRVHAKTTRFRLTVPYSLRGFDGWVVTAQAPQHQAPGAVVMTT
jgi:Anti-sigma-K factor rskA